MKINTRPYRGTRDFYPEEKILQNYLFDSMRLTASKFCYLPYDGPLLEEVDLYKQKSGEELVNQQIYLFQDRGERNVAIRPEMTPTLARMIAAKVNELNRPVRWYSIPNLMRYERPQKGRLREHWQFNCDVFGLEKVWGELEILQVAINLLSKFGANDTHFGIKINDRNIINFIAEKVFKLNDVKSLELTKLLDRYYKIDNDTFEQKLTELSLSQKEVDFFKQYITTKTIKDLDLLLSPYSQDDNKEILHDLKCLYEEAKKINIDKYLNYDPCIVRGLDYYTGIVFEIFDKNPENPRALCGGGRYDNLLSIFGKTPLSGCGFGLGDVTLKDFLETHDLLPRDLHLKDRSILISFQTDQAKDLAINLSLNIREHNFNCCLHYESIKIKKSIKLAERNNHSFVVFIGEEELTKNSFSIKNMSTKDQITLGFNDIKKLISFLG